ncbi:Ank3 [Symbiodinium sp. CCMP2592]|nr:Ank3 [Symbiodinium sp. CCMP2592]
MAICTIYQISGAVLLSLTEKDLEEIAESFGNSVKGLKRHLGQLLNLPRFQQRLTSGGDILEDTLPLIGRLPAEVQFLIVSPVPDVLGESFAFDRGAARVERWLQQPVSPNSLVNERGQSPLWVAASRGDSESVELLLEAEADVNHSNREGATPLVVAARMGSLDCARQLVEARADLNRSDSKGLSPLCMATLKDTDDVVTLLLEARADMEQSDEKKQSPLWIAVKNGCVETATCLAHAGANVNKPDESSSRRQPPIMTAVSDGCLDVLEVLLDARADVNQVDYRGYTALHQAALEDSPDAVRRLVAARADLNQTDFVGRAPMSVAANEGHMDSLEALIGLRADVDVADNTEKDTPLHFAARAGQEEGVFCKRHGNTSCKYPDLHRRDRPILMRVFLAGYTIVVCGLRLLLEVGKRREEEIERARKLAGEIEHEYDLFSERDLINFLLDADVRLVRLEYLQELQAARRLWPRRQEAEQELLRDGRSALVTREELQRLEPGDGQEANAVQVLRQGYQTYFDVTVSNMAWSTQAFLDTRTVPTLFRVRGKRTGVRIVSVSHSWEAMQHPDPWGFQLRELCERLVPGKGEHEMWVFVDFMSLYQYKRTPEQQKSFHHAMANMHCLYAHAAISEVIRLDVLTSPTSKPFFPKPISIYSDKTERLEMRPFKELVMNDTPYAFRGWCRAEIQWSSLLHDIGTYAPMSPADFSQAASSMESDSPKSFWRHVVERTVGTSRSMPRGTGLKFTHRSDLEKVIELQERVFKQVAPQRLSVVAHGMSPAEMVVFGRALPQYRNLRVLWIRDSKIGEVGIKELLAALKDSAGLVGLILSNCDVGDAEAALIADFLEQSRTLQYLRLDCNHISTQGAFTLAASLTQNRTIKELGVNGNPIDKTGWEALKRSAEKGLPVLSACSLETTVTKMLQDCEKQERFRLLKQGYH